MLTYSNDSAQFNHNNNGIPMQICIIYSLYQYILPGCPQSLGELKPAEACCCFQNSLVGCLGLIPLCGAEHCVHSPHAGLADSEINISPPVSLLSWQCHLCTLCSPWCGDKVSFFARTMVSHTLWCSELPNTETFSSVRIYCSVTKP